MDQTTPSRKLSRVFGSKLYNVHSSDDHVSINAGAKTCYRDIDERTRASSPIQSVHSHQGVGATKQELLKLPHLLDGGVHVPVLGEGRQRRFRVARIRRVAVVDASLSIAVNALNHGQVIAG